MQRCARSLSLVGLTLAVIAGGAAAAQAAAPWSEPQSTNGGFERILFNADGQGMLIGLGQVMPHDYRLGRVLAAPVQGGTPGQVLESTTPLNVGKMKVYGRDGVVAGGVLKPGVSQRVALTRGRFGRPLGRPRPLRGRSRSSLLLDLAVNQVGDAVAVVRQCQDRRCIRQTLELFRWRAGARLSRPLRIARGRRLGAGVAINARGDVAILWDRFRRRGRRDVFGQILTASGRLRARQRVGAAPAGPHYRIALTDDRRVVAALGGAGGQRVLRARRPDRCRASQRGRSFRPRPAADHARHDRLRALRERSGGPIRPCSRRPRPDAWSGNEGARWVVRAGELGAAGVESVAVVGDRASDAMLADLAVGPRGEAIVLLADGVGGGGATRPPRLLAVTRGAWPGSSFTAPELVADKVGLGSSVAFDPATGRANVAYPGADAQFQSITSVVTRAPIVP